MQTSLLLKIIKRTKQILKSSGWQQGSMGDPISAYGPHCMLGALYVATQEAPGSHWVRREVYKAFETLEISSGTANAFKALSQWNDTKGRTLTEVINLLTKVEVLLKRGANELS